jgi:sugar lactone lactonase YvrE
MRLLALLAMAAALAPAQESKQFQVERISSGYSFTEGPVWHKDGYLLFSDIPNNRIHKLTPGKGVEVFRENSGGANGLAFDERGRLLACEGNARRLTRTDAKGKIEALAEKFDGKMLNAPNDVAVRKDGQIYFTDPAYGKSEDTKELPFYGVYRVTPKGELSVVSRWEKRPNGIALSPNGRLLYVAAADERAIRAYDLDRQGNASNERMFITGMDGSPDGIKTDEQGNIYAACNGVLVYGPDGKFIRKIEIAERPANLAFGDADLQGLYVTARTTLYRVRLDVKGSSQQSQ